MSAKMTKPGKAMVGRLMVEPPGNQVIVRFDSGRTIPISDLPNHAGDEFGQVLLVGGSGVALFDFATRCHSGDTIGMVYSDE